MYKVIIVDDEEIIRKGFRYLINWVKYGYEIIGYAENGKDALSFLANNNVDLIIVDVKMPVMDGLDFLKAVRTSGWDTEVIVISAYDEFKYAKSAIDYDAFTYLLKPIYEEDLLKALSSIRKKLYKKSMSINSFKIRHMLRNILFGSSDKVDVHTAYELGIKLDWPMYYCAIIKPYNGYQLPINLLIEKLEQLLMNNSLGYLLEDHNRLILLITVDDISTVYINKCMKQILITVKEHAGNRFFIFLGRPVNHYSDINLSYNFANNMSVLECADNKGNILTSSNLNEILKESSTISKIKSYINNNYYNKINIKSISDIFKYNPAYLARMFKQHEGISIKNYLMNLRLEKACKLLIENDMNVTNIALAAGFNSLNKFYSCFRERYDCSPKEYKKKFSIT